MLFASSFCFIKIHSVKNCKLNNDKNFEQAGNMLPKNEIKGPKNWLENKHSVWKGKIFDEKSS